MSVAHLVGANLAAAREVAPTMAIEDRWILYPQANSPLAAAAKARAKALGVVTDVVAAAWGSDIPQLREAITSAQAKHAAALLWEASERKYLEGRVAKLGLTKNLGRALGRLSGEAAQRIDWGASAVERTTEALERALGPQPKALAVLAELAELAGPMGEYPV